MNYARHEHHDFLGATTQALADASLQGALVRLTDTLMAGNRRGYATLADSDKLRDHAGSGRQRLGERVMQFNEFVRRQTMRARTGGDSRRRLTRRCRRPSRYRASYHQRVHLRLNPSCLGPLVGSVGIECRQHR